MIIRLDKRVSSPDQEHSKMAAYAASVVELVWRNRANYYKPII